ncbi:hypothetical protein SAY86_027083 [Trapa natans]|uniref:Uncharacterized protein n=1 Tax=Trapa natans TaxID=22666 RepID=A0AAN7QK53_TRANT|nr:hypothetical protein SAY86_027083 [Trapa natans]
MIRKSHRKSLIDSIILIFCSHILVWKTRKRTAVLRHSMGSSLAVDILLGNLIGLALLYNVKSTCSWIKDYGSDVSNWLRTGCVWLMGVPAGFKLNTKVAAVLGTISLNVTQTLDTHLPAMIPSPSNYDPMDGHSSQGVLATMSHICVLSCMSSPYRHSSTSFRIT